MRGRLFNALRRVCQGTNFLKFFFYPRASPRMILPSPCYQAGWQSETQWSSNKGIWRTWKRQNGSPSCRCLGEHVGLAGLIAGICLLISGNAGTGLPPSEMPLWVRKELPTYLQANRIYQGLWDIEGCGVFNISHSTPLHHRRIKGLVPLMLHLKQCSYENH
jgi:hypothetical protein